MPCVEKILEVNDLRVSFKTSEGYVKAIRGVSFDLYKNEILAIVGESGSGKSAVCKSIISILEDNKVVEDGSISYQGINLLAAKESDLNKIRGSEISMIFQDTMSTLNPIMEVGKQIEESIKKRNKNSHNKVKEQIQIFNKIYPQNFTKKINDLNKKIAKNKIDENAYLSLKDELFKEYKNDLISANSSLFSNDKKMVTDSIEDLSKIIDIFQKELGSAGFFKEYGLLKRKYNHVIEAYKREKNYMLKNFFSTLDSLLKAYKNSFKEEQKRVKLFVDNNVLSYDYYDLNIKEKAKNKEKILTHLDIENKVIESIKKFIAKAKNYLENSKDDSNDIEYIFETYLNMYKKETSEEIRNEVLSLLSEVGLDGERIYKLYPFELSGGMRQRIVIAISLSCSPNILICDEPTTSLDVIIQKQILDLLRKIQKNRNLSIIFVTHDFSIVSKIADRVMIMYAGKVVEIGTIYEIIYDPRHPYTWALMSSIPDINSNGKLNSIKGTVPNMLIPTKGDMFASRNEFALKEDFILEPPYFDISDTHKVASWLSHEYSLDVKPPKVLIDRIKEFLIGNEDKIPQYKISKNSVLEYIKNERDVKYE